jgi:hypothetical protein
MAALGTVLAGIGLLSVLFLLLAEFSESDQRPAPPADDLAAPYREGLHAAVRLQRSAQDLEQQIWAEAARHAGHADAPSNDEQ